MGQVFRATSSFVQAKSGVVLRKKAVGVASEVAFV